jgi:SMI1 / KNR4 family (SUKH-1)
MQSWVNKIVLKWRSEGVKINKPATTESIKNVETILGFQFPNDFKELYLEMNGFLDLDWQEHMFTLWPLEMIINEFNESADKDFVGFCDYLLASHEIGFSKSRSGIYKIYAQINHYENDPIANTFEELIYLINSGDESVY